MEAINECGIINDKGSVAYVKLPFYILEVTCIMEILKCTRGEIVVRLDESFNGVTISATGGRICDWKGFSVSISSIKQIAPIEKVLSAEEKHKIATAINNCKSFVMAVNFFDFLEFK